MKIRKVTAEEAEKLASEAFLTSDVKARLTAYRNWLAYQRHERVSNLGARVIERK